MSHKQFYDNPPESHAELVQRVAKLLQKGWISTRTQESDGLIGNTLEDYLGIKENNDSESDIGDYEIKTQRTSASSLMTLFHLDPYPRDPYSPVTQYLVEDFGWEHSTRDEKSLMQTMTGTWSSRGFRVQVDRDSERVVIEFDRTEVDDENSDWAQDVPGLRETLYWDFDILCDKTKNKLSNIIFVEAESRSGDEGREEFNYQKVDIWQGFDFDAFLQGIEEGHIKIGFNARTEKNRGTKFRVTQNYRKELYEERMSLGT